MNNLTIKSDVLRRTCILSTNTLNTKLFKRDYAESAVDKKLKNRIHPFKEIHPWKSLAEFSEDLARNVIYNKDGLVVLNKPYGISHEKGKYKETSFYHPICNSVNYTLEDALPYIAEQLKYSKLTVVKKPEKYMSGITLLAKDSNVQEKIQLALRRGNNFTSTYWIVTCRVPNKLKGKEHLAMRPLEIKQTNTRSHKTPVIVTSWSNKDQKRRNVKILNVEFKVISNSTLNACSLIQIKSSTMKWHAIRLFAATFLFTPILGDNIYTSRIQKIGDTYVLIDAFKECVNLSSKLDQSIFNLLNLKPVHQPIIPVHIHLRSIGLPSLFKKNEDLIIEAPLMPPFSWTFEQLKFKCSKENK
ncbi:pseudouridylate synthase RPUSD4, mitochondrial isoform X2 [Ptiloglossa arizonensis]